MVRPPLGAPPPNLDAVRGSMTLLQGELRDPASLRAVVAEAAPDELYHLAAPNFVPASRNDPTATVNARAIAGGTATPLAHVRGFRLFVAASSQVFGDAGEAPLAGRPPRGSWCHRR